MNLKIPQTCMRFGGIWISRLEKPKRCKCCSSPYWFTPVVRHAVSAARKKKLDTVESVEAELLKEGAQS
jgi:hypothetical protein